VKRCADLQSGGAARHCLNRPLEPRGMTQRYSFRHVTGQELDPARYRYDAPATSTSFHCGSVDFDGEPGFAIAAAASSAERSAAATAAF
jgi:hypothetical protein